MKVLSNEERAALKLKPQKVTEQLRQTLESLQPGQSLFVRREETKAKDGPGYFVATVRKRTKGRYKVYQMEDQSGWVVDRLA